MTLLQALVYFSRSRSRESLRSLRPSSGLSAERPDSPSATDDASVLPPSVDITSPGTDLPLSPEPSQLSLFTSYSPELLSPDTLTIGQIIFITFPAAVMRTYEDNP